MPTRILLIALILAARSVFAQQKVNVIFDTDMGPDYDDVGAIAMLHAFADSGKANILATMASTNYEGVAAVLNVLNTYFRRPDIPIGVPRAHAINLRDWQHWTDTLQANYPHVIRTNAEVPDAATLYRRVLAAQPDHSVTIVTVGFLTNLSQLLQSKADSCSPLDGMTLVRKKVKALVSMAGRFPSGKEFNIEKDAEAANYTFSHWPSSITFSGFEIGEKILAGRPLVADTSILHSPVKDVFRICIPMAKEDSAGRKSWDETAVLTAVCGYKPYYSLVRGSILIRSDGSNIWTPAGHRQHYLIEASSPHSAEIAINRLIMHQPRR